MKAKIIRAFIGTSALAALCAGSGCVADRPSRNDVFNENQYIRKDFLIRPGSGGVDPGWFMQATITASSVPNPLANMVVTGDMNGGSYVNFVVTSDKLLMNNMIEPSVTQLNNGYAGNISAQGTRNQETVDSWDATNVDLKYQVNLDGEKTNEYQENQELDWQLRQWVKVNFDKNDQSDFVPFGDMTNEFIDKCTDATDISSTLDPNSFYVDETNNYWQFGVDVTVPIAFNSLPSVSVDTATGQTTTTEDPYCADQFGFNGHMFQQLGRQNVTFTILYSFTRAPEDPRTSLDGSNVGNQTPALTYMPLVVPEKDNIQRKYQAFTSVIPAIDPNTGLWNARQLVVRHDPKAKQVTYYFAQGFPNEYKSIFGNPDKAGCTDACTFSGGGGGVIDQTNALFKAAGASTKMVVMDYDANLLPGQPPREFGDVRFSFLRWVSDLDTGAPFIGVTQFASDPRSGQEISTSISMVDNPWQDTLLARMDYYEQSIGAFNFSAPGTNGVPGSCQIGDTIPLVPPTIAANHNGSSTLFAKMQQYLNKPVATWGNLGPSDFIVKQDNDFFNAFFQIIPYEVFNDPAANPFVVWQGGGGNYGSAATQIAAGEGEATFHLLAQQIDQGWAPYDVDAPNGPAGSSAFLTALQQATVAHRNYQYVQRFAFPMRAQDDTSMYSLPGAFAKDARHCISDGKGGATWETRAQYVQNLVRSYYAETWWHEFGHSLGMRHNFMASVDRQNWPHYKDPAGRDHIGLYESSIMDYNITADSTFWSGAAGNPSGDPQGGGVSGQPGWAPYDQAAISWIYANSSTTMDSFDSGKSTGISGASYSGQSGGSLATTGPTSGMTVSKTNSRWNDPFGYCPPSGTTSAGQSCTPGNEIEFLFCTDQHLQYTPFCRQFDFGTTPTEIIADYIDEYEWQYVWRNFPQYHQYYDFEPYANGPANFFQDARRFLSSWDFDWSQGELSDNFRKLGVQVPAGIPQSSYYVDLGNAFNNDASMAGQLYAATTEAIINQASGERPFITTYDSYFGDTTQQGIQLDKLYAVQGFTALWAIDNYDQNQAAGVYIAPFSFPGDSSYEGVAEEALLSFLGGFPSFPYAQPLPVQQFAAATHSNDYQTGAVGGRQDMKDWIGGYTFSRLADFRAFFQNLAVQYQLTDANGNVICPNNVQPDPVAACSYDPRTPTAPEDPLAIYHSDPFNQFTGPDERRWIWVYLQDLNTWIVADRDRNVASWSIMYSYNSDVLYLMDSTGGGYALEYPIKYMLNAYASTEINPNGTGGGSGN